MLKHEIKVEFSNSEVLKTIIEKAYFEEGNLGKIQGKSNYFILNESVDEEAHSIIKGLHNATIKLSNIDVIDGSMRFIVEENEDEIKLYPISIYCIKEEDKYSFY